MIVATAPTVPAITWAAVRAALKRGMEPMRAEPPQWLSEWADEHFYLSAESSHTQGGWEAYPFQLGIMDWMSDDRISELSIKKSKRVGYTKMLSAFMAYNACHRRRKLALWQPTDDDRDSFVKSEVDPMLRDVKAFDGVKLHSTSEDTLKLKQFVGSVWHLLGGKAARAYRRITVAVVLLDELDGFDQQIEKSSDPVTLARGRLEGAPFPKLVAGSTPRIKGLSHTDYRYSQAGAQMAYHIACPHCGREHPLEWGGKKVRHGFKWDPANPADVWHVCPHCDGRIRQADYMRLWRTGEWIDLQGRYRYGRDRIWRDGTGQPCQPPAHVGAHVWTAYSPQRDWSDIVREFLEAHGKLKAGDPGPMQGFVNETKGDVWEQAGDRADGHELQARAESYPLRKVPMGGLVLVAGVDVQDNRFEVVVWAIGRGFEMWPIDYVVLRANPADAADWARLDAYLCTRFPHEGGQRLAIDAVAIDSGGHFTHFVYQFAAARDHRRVFAIRGEPRDGQPIVAGSSLVDINAAGTVIKRGVRLWRVGTDTAKDLLYARLKVAQPGPGYVHFSRELPNVFYAQLTNEHRVEQTSARGTVHRWVPKAAGVRVEVLDCTVYALFAAHRMDLHRYTDAMWDRQQAAVCPPTADLFDHHPSDVEPLAPLGDVIDLSDAPEVDPPADQVEEDARGAPIPQPDIPFAAIQTAPRGRRIRGAIA